MASMPGKTHAEPQSKIAPTATVTQQPALPEKQAGPTRAGVLQRADALPPPVDAAALMEPGGGSAGRARMMRAMQGNVGNARLSRMVDTTTPRIQRTCACGGEAGPDEECAACKARREAIQRQSDAPTEAASLPASVMTALRSGGGQSLDPATRGSMEQAFGADFSGVRVHTDAGAATAARDINAKAFTSGQNIYFGSGQHQPGTPSGDKLLAHELTHTVQQAERRPELQSSPAVSRPGDPLEREAEAAADQVMSGRPALAGVRAPTGGLPAATGAWTQRQAMPGDAVSSASGGQPAPLERVGQEEGEEKSRRGAAVGEDATDRLEAAQPGLVRIQRYSWDAFTSDLGAAGRAIASVPGQVVDTARNVAGTVYDTVSNVASGAYGAARDLASGAYDLAHDAISGAFNTAREVVSDVVSAGSQVASQVQATGERVLRSVSRSARTVAEGLYHVASRISRTLLNTATTVGRTLLNAVLAAGRGLLNAGAAVFNAVRQLIDTVRNVVNRVSEWLRRQAQRLMEWLLRRREFHLPDFKLFGRIERLMSHFDATEDVPLASTTVAIPYIGPTVIALFGRGELLATLGIGIGPGMLQNIHMILDPGAGYLEGDATLNVPAELEGSLSLTGILAVSANPSCAGEVIRVEGGLSVTGTGSASTTLSETVIVTYQEGELDFSHKGSLDSCLGFTVDLDALANLYILEYPLLSGQWNLLNYPWDKCWKFTWPEADGASGYHGGGGQFGGGGASDTYDQGPGQSAKQGGHSFGGFGGGAGRSFDQEPRGGGIQRAAIPTSLILRAPIQRANGDGDGAGGGGINVGPLADVPFDNGGGGVQSLPAPTRLGRLREAINRLMRVGDPGPSLKAAELLRDTFGPTKPIITQHPLDPAQMKAIENGSPCPVPPKGGKIPTVVFDSAVFPNIAPHIKKAQGEGHPRTLSRTTDPSLISRNRREACSEFTGPDSCDEYPFASTYEGGRGASIASVPRRENSRQGGFLGAFFGRNKVGDKDKFNVDTK